MIKQRRIISEPVSAELRAIHGDAHWKSCTWYFKSPNSDDQIPYVTVEFHEAMLAEMRARWERDIERLERIAEALQSDLVGAAS